MRHFFPPDVFLKTQSIGTPGDGCNPVTAFAGQSAETDGNPSRSVAILLPECHAPATYGIQLQRDSGVTPPFAGAHRLAIAINPTHSVTCDPPVLDRELAATGERLVLELIARRQATKYKYIVDSIGHSTNPDPDTAPYDSVVSGNALHPHNSPTPCVLRREREENFAHGSETEPNEPTIQHHASPAAPEGHGTGDRSDRWGLRPERGRAAPARPGAAGNGARAPGPVSDIAGIAGRTP